MSRQGRRTLVGGLGVLATLIMIGGVFLIIQAMTSTGVRAEGSSPPAGQSVALDPVGYDRLAAIRKMVLLTDQDLAQMGLSSSEAQAALTVLRQWYLDRAQDIAAALNAVAGLQRQMADIERRRAVGPRDDALPAQMARLRASLVTAQNAYRDLAETCVAPVEAVLTPEHRSVCQMARANRGAGEFRFASGVTRTQLHALNQAKAALTDKLATAKTADAATAARSEYTALESRVLSVDQQAAMAAARENLTRCTADIMSAAAEVLPRPKINAR